MIQRTLTAIAMLAILIPVFIVGGNLFALAILAIAIIALKELLDVKQTKKELPSFIAFISYVLLSLLILMNMANTDLIYSIDYRFISGLFLAFSIPTVIYQDRKFYSIVDAFYLIGSVFFLGISFSLIILLRNVNLVTIVYLFLITIITDTYAYIMGSLIGKHKLAEKISPNKSWEGTIFGTLVGTFVATLYFTNFVDSSVNLSIVIFMTAFLSVLGQFGDLFFSSIKRYYGKKDFSNILPGHGGVLDRFDSVLFVVLGYMFFISII